MRGRVMQNSANILSSKQDKKDSRLITTDKTIVGAINELKNENANLADNEQIIEIQEEIELLKQTGGGGGSPLPKLTSDFSKTTCSTDEIVTLNYFFTSPNIGGGKAYYSIDNIEVGEPIDIKQGKNVWNVGKLLKGQHVLKLYVTDIIGGFSNELSFNIASGSLEIISRFDSARDYTVTDSISIPYTVSSITLEPITMLIDIDGIKSTISVSPGDNKFDIGVLPLGKHSATLVAKTPSLTSNILKLTIMISDSNTLFLSTEFDKTSIVAGTQLVIDYRISMKNETKFKVFLYKNGVLASQVNGLPGANFWTIGELEEGAYTFKINATTMDGLRVSNDLNFSLEIVSGDYTPLKPVTSGLIARFDASIKDNNQINRNIWDDRSGNNVKFELFNLNYSSNGWVKETTVKEDGTSKTESYLKMNGETYGVMDMRPFLNDIPDGLTFDILFRTRNVGDLNARVLSCQNPTNPYNGIWINTYEASMKSWGKGIKVAFSEDTWTRVTYTIDRINNVMLIYINGIIAEVSLLSSNGVPENFYTNQKVYINSSINENGTMGSFGSCEIKSIKVYNKALHHEEILQNYLADFEDKAEQKAKYDLSYGDTISAMYFYGDTSQMTKENKVPLRIKYMPKAGFGTPFDLPACSVSWQGTSSIQYAVKNYKIRLLDSLGAKFKYAPLEHWIPESTFTLKADYMESSHANNVGTAKLVSDMYKTKLPPQISNPKVRVAIDGFPIQLYINNELIGIYMFDIDKSSSSTFGFSSTNPNCLSYEVAANSDYGAGAFNDYTMEAINREFEVRFPDAPKTEHPELQALIRWVKESSDEVFKAEFEQHFNKAYTIDYFIQVLTFGMVDNLGKNMMLSTWDGKIWVPSFYDMDTMLGLDNSGFLRFGPDIEIEAGNFNTSESQLWSKVQRVFWEDIRTRYAELRTKHYTYDNIMSYYNGSIISLIGERYYNNDANTKYLKYGDQYLHMCHGNRLEHMKRWIKERLLFIDTVMRFEVDTVEKVTVRANKAGEVSLRLKTYSPQYVTISFQNGVEVRKFVTKDYWTEFTGEIKTATDQEVIITNAKHLLAIDGIQDLNTSFLDIKNAAKLTEINCSNSTRLITLALSNNALLQKLNCSNCKNLGTGTGISSTLDLSKCVNLKEFDCSNTKLTAVYFNPSGGSFKTMNLSNTLITQFELANQEFLQNINLNGCTELVTFSLNNCNNVTKVEMPNTKMNSFSIIDCNKLETLDISYNSRVTSLNLDGCPNLKTLKMTGISSSSITDLDLSPSIKLESLDISGCSFLKTLTFDENYRTLKRMTCRDSVLIAVRFGKRNPMPTYLDLSRFTLEFLDFYNCTDLTEVRNINYVATTSSSPFYNCKSLISITGSMKLVNDISCAFYNCQKLTSLPTLDLTDATYASETFSSCTKLTMQQATYIMSRFGPKLTGQWRMFANCTGLLTPPPSTFFNTVPNLTSIGQFFCGCSGIAGEIPDDLFAPLTKLTNSERAFMGCTGITGGLTANTFKKNTLLSYTVYMYSGCTKLSYPIPALLFSENTALSTITGMFFGCTGIQSRIPVGLFSKNINLRYADEFFTNCTGLYGSIPRDLFINNPNLVTVNKFLYGCKNITGTIPAYVSSTDVGLLDNNKNIQNIGYLFFGCTGLTGEIPVDFLKNNNALLEAPSVFEGCTGLNGKIPPTIFKNKTLLTNINGFFKDCVGLISEIPVGLLDDCRSLVRVSRLFFNCPSLYGEIPRRISTFQTVDNVTTENVTQYGLFDNTSNVIEGAGIFYNCRGLISEIPPTIFMNFRKVVDLSSVFGMCHKLYGPIPNNLFENCVSLVYLVGAFKSAANLGERVIDAENPYAIPEDLFYNCPNIKDVSYMFEMFDWGTSLKGAIPSRLFESCRKIENAYRCFAGASSLTGGISKELFQYCVNLTNVCETFYACPSLDYLDDNVFINNMKITTFEGTFRGCPNLKGNANPLWSTHTAKSISKCYENCIGLSNYESIPTTWK